MDRPPIVAAVIGRDGVALDDGTLNEDPPPWWDNLVMLLRMLGKTCGMDATVLWDVKEWPDTADELQKEGWQFKEFRPDWTSFTRLYSGALQTISIGLLPKVDGHRLFDAKTDPWPVIVQRLAQYRKLAGVAWRGRPGINGIQLLRNLYQDKRPGHQPRWFLAKGPGSPKWTGTKMWPAGDLQWKREPNAVEAHTKPHIVRFDINGQYLAAAGNAFYAWGELEHSDRELFDPKRAGYWQVLFDEITHCWPSPLPGIIGARRRRPDGTVWLTTPIMALLQSRGCSPDVIESWTAPGRRFLVPWMEQYRNARLGMLGDASDPHVRGALKSTPNEAIGFFNRRGGRCYRPDWQHTTMDTARSNHLRKLLGVFELCGEVPLRVDYDSVWYPEGPAAEALEKLKATHPQQLGKYRHVSTTPFSGRDWERIKAA